jgi:hypothetical protein
MGHNCMDPVIEEFGRVRDVKDIRYSKLREWQAYLKNVVQPRLDKLAQIEATNGKGKTPAGVRA